jgi:hypothetical protein
MNELMWATLLAWMIPPVVSALKKQSWPVWAKQTLCGVGAFGVAVVSGIITGHVTLDSLDLEKFFAAAGWAFAEAQVVYQLYFKGTPANATLTKALWGDRSSSDAIST